MPESTYSVYLVRTAKQANRVRGGERQVTSPVEGTALDFYDSGVWLTRESGRNFFPYDQIRTIREHPEGERGEGGRAEEVDSSEGRSESGDDRENAAERDPGAEEDLVE